MNVARLRGALVATLALILFLSTGACASEKARKAPATTGKETPMSTSQPDVTLGENQRVTLDGYKVALAKCWEEDKEKSGKKVSVAWLSVVKEGSEGGAKDLELSPGDTLALGATTWTVKSVQLETADTSGSVILSKQ